MISFIYIPVRNLKTFYDDNKLTAAISKSAAISASASAFAWAAAAASVSIFACTAAAVEKKLNYKKKLVEKRKNAK